MPGPLAVTLAGLLVASLSLLAPSPAHAAGASIGAATKAQKLDAQKRYDEASALFKKGQFEQALSGARASYELVASPNSHLLVAYALRELGRQVEAYAEVEQVVVEADEAAQRDGYYAETARAARAELTELRSQIALLTVSVKNAPEGATVKVRGEALPRARWGRAIALKPGPTRVELALPSGPPVARELSLSLGQAESVELDAAPPAPPPVAVDEGEGRRRSLRTGGYVAAGVGVAGLAAFGVLGAMNQSRFHDLQSACPSGRCPPDKQGDIDGGKRLQLGANVGLAVGVIGVAASATLLVLGREKSSPQAALVAGPGHVAVQGSF